MCTIIFLDRQEMNEEIQIKIIINIFSNMRKSEINCSDYRFTFTFFSLSKRNDIFNHLNFTFFVFDTLYNKIFHLTKNIAKKLDEGNRTFSNFHSYATKFLFYFCKRIASDCMQFILATILVMNFNLIHNWSCCRSQRADRPLYQIEDR